VRAVLTLVPVRLASPPPFALAPLPRCAVSLRSFSAKPIAETAGPSTVSSFPAVSAFSSAMVAEAATTPVVAPRVRTIVTSAQIRAQRPRASKAAAASNPDTSLAADSCGPVLDAPEMVNVVNAATGERMGPRGLEPTRYGDWEAKGRCWDF
jgi:hypothetical protein